MSYLKQLQEQIERQEDNVSLLISEIDLLKNEIEDVYSPNLLILEQTQLILQMLTEYLDFVKKKGESEINKRSKARILRLLEINSKISAIGDQNAILKIINNRMYGKHNRLVEKFNALQLEIKKIKDAEEF